MGQQMNKGGEKEKRMRTKGGYRAKQSIKHSAPPKGILGSSNCSWDPSPGLLPLDVLARELDWPLRRSYSSREEALRCSSDSTQLPN